MLAAVVLFLISSWPLPRQRETLDFPAAYSLDNPEMPPVVLHRVIYTSIPQKMRIGEFVSVKLEFAPAISSEIPERVTTESTGTYFLEARLEIPGVTVTPGSSITQPLIAHKTLHYTWELIPLQKGEYPGTLWVYVVVVDDTTQKPEYRPVLAVPIQVEAVGMPISGVGAMRIAGGLCIFAALLLTLLNHLTKRMEGEHANTPTG